MTWHEIAYLIYIGISAIVLLVVITRFVKDNSYNPYIDPANFETFKRMKETWTEEDWNTKGR